MIWSKKSELSWFFTKSGSIYHLFNNVFRKVRNLVIFMKTFKDFDVSWRFSSDNDYFSENHEIQSKNWILACRFCHWRTWKVSRILAPWSPGSVLVPEMLFWVPKPHFGFQNALFALKSRFRSIPRPGLKSLWNKWFEHLFFALLEWKCGNSDFYNFLRENARKY